MRLTCRRGICFCIFGERLTLQMRKRDRGMAQPDSAHDLGPCRRRCKSSHSDQFTAYGSQSTAKPGIRLAADGGLPTLHAPVSQQDRVSALYAKGRALNRPGVFIIHLLYKLILK